MAERQTVDQYHVSFEETVERLIASGLPLPDEGTPRIRIGNDERQDILVIEFGAKAYDWVVPHRGGGNGQELWGDPDHRCQNPQCGYRGGDDPG